MSGVAVAMVGSAVIGGYAANKAAGKAADANQAAIDANAYQGEIAKDQYADYKETYRPLEHQLVADAANFDTPEAYDKAAGDAQATVSSQLGLARDRLTRTPGLDPSSAAAQAAGVNMELKGAATGASAQNAAREGVKNMAYARKLDAVGLGKGLVSGASTGLASAAAGAASIGRNASAEAGQTAAGVGAMVSGAITGIAKNFGGSGTGSSTVSSNPGASADGFVHWDE